MHRVEIVISIHPRGCFGQNRYFLDFQEPAFTSSRARAPVQNLRSFGSKVSILYLQVIVCLSRASARLIIHCQIISGGFMDGRSDTVWIVELRTVPHDLKDHVRVFIPSFMTCETLASICT